MPILVDPARGRSWDFHPAGELIKANLAEARHAAELVWALPVELLDMLGRDRPVVITAGADGIYWATGSRSGRVPGSLAEQMSPSLSTFFKSVILSPLALLSELVVEQLDICSVE